MRRLTNKAVPALLMSVLMTTQGFAQNFTPLSGYPGTSASEPWTATPIKHLVVIYGENESFDHYFGTYPSATNPPGEPAFHPQLFTPQVNGLNWQLLNNNPNKTNTGNGAGAFNPFRLDRTQAHTASMNHAYEPEQEAFDNGKMDLFPKYTGRAGSGGTGAFITTGLVLGYYDGNTVTALWNYAQHFALNDNSYSSQFGPSTVGAINLISGQTNGAIYYTGPTAGSPLASADDNSVTNDGHGGLTVIGDPDPYLDVCAGGQTVEMQGKHIGDLLNARNISWGWFEGGFDLTLTNSGNTYYPYSPASTTGRGAGCQRASSSLTLSGAFQLDYVPHHQPFQYYASTRNPNHTRPASVKVIGTSNDGGANHQYDSHDFFDALLVGNLPSVTYLKAPKFQNAHPSNSDPLDEQTFVVSVINALQNSPFWASTAVIVAYDDSDGWYDHANHVINPSFGSADALEAAGQCKPLPGTFPAFPTPLPGINGTPANGRCGYGARQPFLVISPWAKHNFVDHTVTDQSSIVRFIEDNWLGGQRIGQGSYDAYAGSLINMFDFFQLPITKLKLDPTTGLVAH